MLDPEAQSRRLIGDWSIERFNREIRERRVARFDAAFAPSVWPPLYDVGRLDAALTGAVIPLPFIDVYRDGQLVKLADMQHRSGKSSVAILAAQLREGATVRVRELQTFDAAIAGLTAAVQRLFAVRAQVNLYLTPPSSEGFPPHFDITDAFIVQCSGAKSWTIFHHYADRKELPLAQTPWEPQRYTPEGQGDCMLLSAGDVLYVPRGAMHSAACLDRASLHLTISLSALTVADLLAREVTRFAESNVELRRRALWAEQADTAELTAQVRSHFRRLAQLADSRAWVEAERQAIWVDAGPLAGDGVLAACLAQLEATVATGG
jgi:JmjC domain